MSEKILPEEERTQLERVQGISRFYEMLWIKRNAEGEILQVYDNEYRAVEKIELHRSFITIACDGGFTYKGEFIAMQDENAEFKRRALHLQRRKREHLPESYLKEADLKSGKKSGQS